MGAEDELIGLIPVAATVEVINRINKKKRQPRKKSYRGLYPTR